jgi:hypothetical protein
VRGIVQFELGRQHGLRHRSPEHGLIVAIGFRAVHVRLVVGG